MNPYLHHVQILLYYSNIIQIIAIAIKLLIFINVYHNISTDTYTVQIRKIGLMSVIALILCFQPNVMVLARDRSCTYIHQASLKYLTSTRWYLESQSCYRCTGSRSLQQPSRLYNSTIRRIIYTQCLDVGLVELMHEAKQMVAVWTGTCKLNVSWGVYRLK